MEKELESKIISLVAEWCSAHPIEVDADREDFNGVEDFLTGCYTLDQFNDRIMEAYRDQEEYLTSRAIPEAQRSVAEALGKPLLASDEAELVRSEVWANIEVEWPFAQWGRQKIRVDLIFKGSVRDSSELGYDKAALDSLISLFMDQGVACTESASKSIDEEIAEAKERGTNVLCALATITVAEYFDLLESPLAHSVELTPQHYVGFYDPWCGGGSKMGIEVPGKVLVPAEMLTQVLLENSTGHSKGFVTADHVYGFVSRAFVETRVIDTEK